MAKKKTTKKKTANRAAKKTTKKVAKRTSKKAAKKRSKKVSIKSSRPGALGGRGFLSLSNGDREAELIRCTERYGYRSCLASVMLLQKQPKIRAGYGEELEHSKRYLMSRYGGAGSFGPRKNPDDGAWNLIPDLVSPYRSHIRCYEISEADGKQILSAMDAKVMAVPTKKKAAKKASKKSTSKSLAKNPRPNATRIMNGFMRF